MYRFIMMEGDICMEIIEIPNPFRKDRSFISFIRERIDYAMKWRYSIKIEKIN